MCLKTEVEGKIQGDRLPVTLGGESTVEGKIQGARGPFTLGDQGNTVCLKTEVEGEIQIQGAGIIRLV